MQYTAAGMKIVAQLEKSLQLEGFSLLPSELLSSKVSVGGGPLVYRFFKVQFPAMA